MNSIADSFSNLAIKSAFSSSDNPSMCLVKSVPSALSAVAIYFLSKTTSTSVTFLGSLSLLAASNLVLEAYECYPKSKALLFAIPTHSLNPYEKSISASQQSQA